jgi:hypothetical protein
VAVAGDDGVVHLLIPGRRDQVRGVRVVAETQAPVDPVDLGADVGAADLPA